MLLRYLAIRRQLVDDAGQGGGQLLEQFLLVEASALRDLADHLRPMALPSWLGLIGWFWPVPTQESATLPWPPVREYRQISGT